MLLRSLPPHLYALIIVWSLFSAGCALMAKPVPHVIVERSPDEIITALERTPNSFPTFRGWIKASMKYPFEGKEKNQSFDAALLYNKETKSMRLQGFGMFGQTYFDMTFQPNDMMLYLPSSAQGFFGDPSRLTSRSDAGVFLVLQKTIEGVALPLDRADVLFPEDSCSPVVLDQGKDYSVIKVNPQTLLIDERLLFREEKLVGIIRYDDYRRLDGVLLPYHLQIELPHRDVSCTLHFESFTLNEELPQKLFQLPAPENILWFPLTDLHIESLL